MFTEIKLFGNPALFPGFIMLIILLFSSPLFSPFVFVLFPLSCELIRGKKPVTQTALLLSGAYIAAIAVFFNQFFLQYFILLLLSCLYFSVLILLDCILVYHLIMKSSYALTLIFLYSTASRVLLGLSDFVFPFYWTLSSHLLPVMNQVTRFLLPVFFESICIIISAALYLRVIKKLTVNMILQIALIIFISVIISLAVKWEGGKRNPAINLECAIIQGGYSGKDYALIETYPVLRDEMVRRYIKHLEESPRARLIILPESAFPVYQGHTDSVLQTIKDIAVDRNEYIMTSILLKEKTEVYNAVALINPKGQTQAVYRKRNVMLFVESGDFKRGKDKTMFTVDAYTIAPLICFDAVFLRNYIQGKPPDLYIVTSNDVFAEGTVVSRLHQGYSLINARMTGVPLLQVTQNGPSFYVDVKGRLTNLTRPYEQVERRILL